MGGGVLTSGTCCYSARNSSRINAKSSSQEHPAPVDDEASAAGATEGVVSPDRVPLRVGHDLPAGNDSVERALPDWAAAREWAPRAGQPRRDLTLGMKSKTKQAARESKTKQAARESKTKQAARESKTNKSNKTREQTKQTIKTSNKQPKKGKEKENKAARHKDQEKADRFR